MYSIPYSISENIIEPSQIQLGIKMMSEDLGTKMMSEDYYPSEIQNLLQVELENLIEKLLKEGYEAVLEIGSAKSVNADFIVNKGIKYYGIDINNYLIDIAKQNFEKKQISSNAQNYVLSFFALNSDFNVFANHKKILIFLPFNLFGNLGNPEILIEKLLRLKRDFMISTFSTNSFSNKIRWDYYQSCGFTDLKFIQNETSVTFKSKEGLHSIAYSQKYLNTLIQKIAHNLSIEENIKIFNKLFFLENYRSKENFFNPQEVGLLYYVKINS